MAVKIANVSVTTTAANATITGGARRISVVNVDGGGIIYFRLDGTTAVNTHTDENHAVPAVAGAFKEVAVPNKGGGATYTVSIIGSAACKASVEAIDF